MARAFVVYATNIGRSDIEALFDREWGNPNRRGPINFKSSESNGAPYLPIGVFLPKKEVESEWLGTDGAYFLRINRNNLYEAIDVLNGKASEYVERLWNILDET